MGSPPEREPRQQLRDEQQPGACGEPDTSIARQCTRAVVALAGMLAGIPPQAQAVTTHSADTFCIPAPGCSRTTDVSLAG